MAVYGAQTGKQNKISSSSTGKPVRESIISSSALSVIEIIRYANKYNQIILNEIKDEETKKMKKKTNKRFHIEIQLFSMST